MTIDVVDDLSPINQYVALAAQTTFDYDFPIFEEADLVVDVDGAPQALGTDYTVENEGNNEGGTVTFLVALTGGEIVTIYRDIPIARSSEYQQNGPWSSSATNAEFNRIVMMLQQLEANHGRALRWPKIAGVASADLELSPLSNWLSKYVFINASGEPEPAENIVTTTLTQSVIGALLNPQTAAELAAGVTPTNYAYPSCDIRRYGGATSALAAVNDTAFERATLVSGQTDEAIVIPNGVWSFSAAWSLTGTGQEFGGIGAPVGGVGARGARVICPDGIALISFSGIAAGTDCVVVGGANLPQVELRNLQFDFDETGRDGLVMRGTNMPIVDNVMLIGAERDAWVMDVDGATAQWIEKGEFSVRVRFAGRHALRISLTGTADPYVNECLFKIYEVRGVSERYDDGAALYMEAVSGLGGASKISDNVFLKTVWDCIYNSSDTFTPDVSPVVAAEHVVVQNLVFLAPAWESTGGDTPGVGYAARIDGGDATWSGLTMIASLTNSFWGSNGIDPAIGNVTDFDYSFHRTRLMGPVTVTGTAGTTVVSGSGNSTADSQADCVLTRTGSPVDALAQGASFRLGNTTGSTFIQLQEHAGAADLWHFSGGAWNKRFRFGATGGVHFLAGLQNFADDAAAALGGVTVGQLYRNGSVVMIRVA